MDEDLPVGAFILTLIGGILILVAGFYVALVGGALSDAGYGVLGGITQGLGELGVFFGLLLVILSFLVFFQPEHHVGYGIVIVVLSLLSVLTGAGFILGLLLGLIGGILAIIFPYSEDLELPSGGLPTSPWGRRCENCQAWVTGPQSYCSQCGSPLR